MTRFLSLLLLALLGASPAWSGDTTSVSGSHRSAILAAVNAEFLHVDPCGTGSAGPSNYRIDHVAMEDEWACLAGSARYQCENGPFAVDFIALLKWNCGCWNVSSISFDAKHVTRQKLIGLRRVPTAILPRWIRWSP
jgi:hypothetical protein